MKAGRGKGRGRGSINGEQWKGKGQLKDGMSRREEKENENGVQVERGR